MSYRHVIPRDLFNEAKLLKCLGQLALLAMEDPVVSRRLTVEHVGDIQGFNVELDNLENALYVSNLVVRIRGRAVRFQSPYNSRAAYPLEIVHKSGNVDVFDGNGRPTPEFLDLLVSV
jgi:hypothetical protein